MYMYAALLTSIVGATEPPTLRADKLIQDITAALKGEVDRLVIDIKATPFEIRPDGSPKEIAMSTSRFRLFSQLPQFSAELYKEHLHLGVAEARRAAKDGVVVSPPKAEG